MSEPMSNVEIEDVLSSIRRLVSEDLSPQARALRQAAAPAGVPAPQVAAPQADKLLLTPALRIVPDQEPAVEPESAPEPELTFRSHRGEAPFVAVDDAAEEAALRQALSDSAYDDDGAAAPMAEPAAIPHEVFAAEAEVQEAPKVEWQDQDAPEAEPEAAPEDWADAAEAAVRAELADEVESEAYARFLDDTPEEVTFDEAAMRELVRDIIREELQGTLGERITRNVRKLVRAEIARAMAVRDFE